MLLYLFIFRLFLISPEILNSHKFIASKPLAEYPNYDTVTMATLTGDEGTKLHNFML